MNGRGSCTTIKAIYNELQGQLYCSLQVSITHNDTEDDCGEEANKSEQVSNQEAEQRHSDGKQHIIPGGWFCPHLHGVRLTQDHRKLERFSDANPRIREVAEWGKCEKEIRNGKGREKQRGSESVINRQLICKYHPRVE